MSVSAKRHARTVLAFVNLAFVGFDWASYIASIMKKGLLFSLIAMAILLQACQNEDLLRVEKVIGGYNCNSRCEVYDLVAQGDPTIVTVDSVLYVTRPLEDEDGFIALLDDEVYITKDLTFDKSLVNYSLSGKFDGAGGLSISTDIVDTQNNIRTKCVYTCVRQ